MIIRPDQTYEVKIDNAVVASGNLEDDLDFLPPRKINDPAVKKPHDWDDRIQIDDPNDIKPEVTWSLESILMLHDWVISILLKLFDVVELCTSFAFFNLSVPFLRIGMNLNILRTLVLRNLKTGTIL